jgi:hypothetical protein
LAIHGLELRGGKKKKKSMKHETILKKFILIDLKVYDNFDAFFYDIFSCFS